VKRLNAFFRRLFKAPPLTPARIRTAYVIAVVVDVLQLVLGPLGWEGADQVLDLVAMVLIWRTLGFHPLLLPTFALEFLPLADALPTWTGCVALVVLRRNRLQAAQPPAGGDVIDV
jgi:hypothetical protein